MKKPGIVILALTALIGMLATADAGIKSTDAGMSYCVGGGGQNYTWSQCWAYGAVADVRSAAASNYIACTIDATSVSCYYGNGTSGYTCQSTDPNLIRVAATIHGDSHVQFGSYITATNGVWLNGISSTSTCTSITVVNGSQWAPKQP